MCVFVVFLTAHFVPDLNQKVAAFTCTAYKYPTLKFSLTSCLQCFVSVCVQIYCNIILYNTLSSVFGKGTLNALFLTHAETHNSL